MAKGSCTYVKIDDESDLSIIYDLFKHNIVGDYYNSIICLYYGIYYQVSKNYDLMEKYYLLAIDYGNNDAMLNLGAYYQYTDHNCDLMKKYYLIAIKHNNDEAMLNFGYYYGYNEKNYDLMKEYYLMAINCGNNAAMHYLAEYYESIKEYDLMKKYYLMDVKCDNMGSMYRLAQYYKRTEKNYDLMMKYYLMGVKKHSYVATKKCSKIYGTICQKNINDAIYFYNIANKLTKKYNTITKASTNNYMVDNKHMTDYMQSMKISILLSKYNNICMNIKQVFMNYKQIMMFLWIVGGLANNIPTNVKLDVITLLVKN